MTPVLLTIYIKLMPKRNEYQLTSRSSKATDAGLDESLMDLPTAVDNRPEPLKFSVRRDSMNEGGSSRRVLIFILIVVALGLGLTFVVQGFINNQGNGGTATSSSTTSSEAVFSTPGAEIGDEEMPDADAPRQIANADYVDTELSLGSNANNTTTLNLEKFIYEPYETFSLTRFQLTEGAPGLPAVKINYLATDLTVRVVFTGVGVTDLGLLQSIPVTVGNVKDFTSSIENGDLTIDIELMEESKYFAAVESGGTLALYIKTNTALAQPSSTSTTTSEEMTSSSTTSSAPATTSSTTTSTAATTSSAAAGDSFTNQMSQTKQSIANSAISGNSLISETYYYQDTGNSFIFSWAMRNGDPAVPNATAEYITDNGKDYIEVKVSNLQYDILHAKGREKAIINISTASSNLVDVYTKGFSGGTATFWVEVKAKKDFRLFATETYSTYRLLSLELAD